MIVVLDPKWAKTMLQGLSSEIYPNKFGMIKKQQQSD